MGVEPRKSDKDHKLSRSAFLDRFLRQFTDPNFGPYQVEITKLAEIAWSNYQEGRKAPATMAAGPGHDDPNYELSIDWSATRKSIQNAVIEHKDPETAPRVLLILSADRNEGTCPGEFSKTSRLGMIAEGELRRQGITVEVLDLSEMTAEFGKMIYPCKGCVSTAMPLCHWPCSCYPNYSLAQTNDWMSEIYPMWVRAHGVMIITPVYWHQAPSCLKLMMDRLVCADGGNPDPTSTRGKDARKAKEMELAGWNYPRHLQGRVYSVAVHGDAIGAEGLRNALMAWLSDMQLLPAGPVAQLARYIGYYEPYATSHDALDEDSDVMQEVRNAASALGIAAAAMKKGELAWMTPELQDPRPK